MSCWPVVCAWRVCHLSLIVRRTAHGPTRHHSRHAIYVCGVGSNAPSPELLRRDATRVHIILADLRQKRCPVSWTLLVVIIPFEPSLRPLKFYLHKGAALWREGPRSRYFTFYQACLYVDSAVSFLVFVLAENWMSFQHLARLSLESVCALKACPALSSRWPGALTHACPSDYLLRKGPTLPDGGALPAGSFSPCPN